jgi:excisionase family DNA binding protein
MFDLSGEFIGRAEVARRLGCSGAAVNRLIRDGRLTAYRIPGTREKIAVAQVHEILADCRREAVHTA